LKEKVFGRFFFLFFLLGSVPLEPTQAKRKRTKNQFFSPWPGYEASLKKLPTTHGV
jgi:hypothetical protein